MQRCHTLAALKSKGDAAGKVIGCGVASRALYTVTGIDSLGDRRSPIPTLTLTLTLTLTPTSDVNVNLYPNRRVIQLQRPRHTPGGGHVEWKGRWSRHWKGWKLPQWKAFMPYMVSEAGLKLLKILKNLNCLTWSRRRTPTSTISPIPSGWV